MSGQIERVWTSADNTDAPDASNLPTGMIGAGADGVAAGIIFHVVKKAWVSTDATVKQFYGGA